MSFIQIREPDLSKHGYRAMCLMTARLLFGIDKPKYATAYQDFKNIKKVFEKQPQGVYSLAHWNYWGQFEGEAYQNYGDVCVVAPDGRVYGSPDSRTVSIIGGTGKLSEYSSVEEAKKIRGNGEFLGYVLSVDGVDIAEESSTVIPSEILSAKTVIFTEHPSVRVRTKPSLKGEIRAQYLPDEVLYNITDTHINDQYVWGEYMSLSGIKSYVALFNVAENKSYVSVVEERTIAKERQWKNSIIPLALYENSIIDTPYKYPSKVYRVYNVIDADHGRVKIYHDNFDSADHTVWVKSEDGSFV